MPVYEYRCPHGHILWRTMSMSAQRLQTIVSDCPDQADCTHTRILSTFGGSFGDTPKHHKGA